MTSPTPSAPRLSSLDQFRGYTVAAMFLVNFMGEFKATPALLRHHGTYCSFADTVMPQFFFAVGFALRLVMLRERERHGAAAAWRRGLRRGLALVLLGVVFYGLDGSARSWAELEQLGVSGALGQAFRRDALQALTHIGLTSLWVLPVIARGTAARLVWAAFSAGLHLWLSQAFWYATLHEWRVIDGGLLGFLTWSLPTLAGSLAHDWLRGARTLPRLVAWGCLAMAAGYALACLSQGGVLAAPPFCPPQHDVDLWTMSQRAASASYLLFAAGLAMPLFAAFVWWCDRHGGRLRLFDTLGQNALAAYLIHMLVLSALDPLSPKDAPLWYAALFTAAGAGLAVAMTAWCNARGLILRL